MDNQEYEQKRVQECWKKFCRHIVDEEEELYNVFDLAYSLGKQEKDADTVTINKGEYDRLCKCSRYMANWVPYFDVCPICGEYNQRGCVCANCYNDKKTKNNKLNSNE